MKRGLNSLWPTHVLFETIENKELLDEATQEILLTTNLEIPPGDFQQYDILRDGSAIMQEFKQKIVTPMFETYLQQVVGVTLDHYNEHWFRSWITGSGHGYNILPHNHSGASVSAVFYLLCEETSAGGDIRLMDPRPNANRGYTSTFSPLFAEQSLRPETGNVLIFPSFLYHYSTVFAGKLRLAMPVDLYLNEG